MYTRQTVTGIAFVAVFALIGLFASLPAFAYETEPADSYYDFEPDDSYSDFDKGMTVFNVESSQGNQGNTLEEAFLPRHVAETIEVN